MTAQTASQALYWSIENDRKFSRRLYDTIDEAISQAVSKGKSTVNISFDSSQYPNDLDTVRSHYINNGYVVFRSFPDNADPDHLVIDWSK